MRPEKIEDQKTSSRLDALRDARPRIPFAEMQNGVNQKLREDKKRRFFILPWFTQYGLAVGLAGGLAAFALIYFGMNRTIDPVNRTLSPAIVQQDHELTTQPSSAQSARPKLDSMVSTQATNPRHLVPFEKRPQAFAISEIRTEDGMFAKRGSGVGTHTSESGGYATNNVGSPAPSRMRLDTNVQILTPGLIRSSIGSRNADMEDASVSAFSASHARLDQIKFVQPIILSNVQLALLGVYRLSDTIQYFERPLGKNALRVSLLPKNQSHIEPVLNSEAHTVPHFVPLLVTNLRGKERVSQFTQKVESGNASKEIRTSLENFETVEQLVPIFVENHLDPTNSVILWYDGTPAFTNTLTDKVHGGILADESGIDNHPANGAASASSNALSKFAVSETTVSGTAVSETAASETAASETAASETNDANPSADVVGSRAKRGTQLSNLQLIISPNPCYGSATVTMSNSNKIQVECAVYDLFGTVVLQIQKPTILTDDTQKQIVNFRELPPGIYIVVLKAVDGVSVSKRLILEH
jgi:hypothetical protein